MIRLTNVGAVVLLAFAVLTLASCGEDGCGSRADAGGADSPAALIELARPLARDNDIGSMVRLIAPRDRPIMAFWYLYSAVKLSGRLRTLMYPEEDEFESPGTEEDREGLDDALDALLAKHGVDLDRVEPDEIKELRRGLFPSPDRMRTFMRENFPNLDHAAVVADAAVFITEFAGDSEATIDADAFAGELENLVTSGDRATGKVSSKTMVFVRLDGRWYLSLESP